MSKVRTRIAPSPTGPMHIGNLRTALFNYLYAKKHGGDFILRIEDTDSKREIEGSIDYLKKSLSWLGIEPNEGFEIGGDCGPYIQSKRKDIYKKYVDKLVESGNAYYAFDTPEEIDSMRGMLSSSGVKNTGYSISSRDRMRNSLTLPKEEVDRLISSGEDYVVRFKSPRDEDIRFKDEVRGWVVFNSNHIDDKVIWKSSDKLPTYHLANVVDDHLMGITHVIRGEEWVSSTPLHILLYKAFEWDAPVFAHLPLILGPDGKKLGKRNKYGIPVFALDWIYKDCDDNELEIKGFKEMFYEPEALFNFLTLLGWNPGGNVEIMSLDYMINSFSLDRVNQSGAMFDIVKLNNFNSHYIKSKDSKWIIDKLELSDELKKTLGDDKLSLISKIAVERVTHSNELCGSLNYLFETPNFDDTIKLKNIDEFISVMNIFIGNRFLRKLNSEDWNSENIKSELEQASNSLDIKLGKIMPMLRVALVGGKSGPQLPDIMYIIGIEETVNRIELFLDRIS